jgi:RimJ/RimL family protein N-acetyltransferase
MTFQIETGRLILRDVREEDIPVLLPILAEEESRRNILSHQWDDVVNKRDLENAMAWARFQGWREYYKLTVALKDEGTPIGTASICRVAPEAFRTVIGWHYSHQYRNQGYATEAARELLRIGFEIGKVSEIYADCFEENIASIRVMQKLGMRGDWNFGLMKFLRGVGYGEYKSTVRYIISRNDWKKQ